MPAQAEARVTGVSSRMQALWAHGVANRAIAYEAAEGDRGAALTAGGAVQILVGHTQMVAPPARPAIGMSAHPGYALLRTRDRRA